jgi:hypothetical protein
MSGKPLFFPMVVASFLCAACNSLPSREAPEEIQEIRLIQEANHGYLDLVVESEMRVTRQTIEAGHRLRDARTRVQQESRNFRMETPETLWRQLLQGCALSAVERIENGKSALAPGDGTDITLVIATTRRKLSFLNGQGEAQAQLEAPCLYPLHCAYFHTFSKSEVSPKDLATDCLESPE